MDGRDGRPITWELQFELLVKVLQGVDTQQRLSICAQVSTVWKRAAEAATTRLTLKLPNQVYNNLLPQLLSKSRITALAITGPQRGTVTVRNLPGLKLEELHLHAVAVQLKSWPGFTGLPLEQAASLTRLDLNQCKILGGVDCLGAITVLTKLQHLSLSFKDNCALPERFLEELPKLTCLQLGKFQGRLEGIRAQTNLHELTITQYAKLGTSLQDLDDLEQLTKLMVLKVGRGHSVNGTCQGSASWLSALTCLEQLSAVHHATLDPVLGCMCMLAFTCLDVSACAARPSAQSVPSLLQVVPQLQQLRVLRIPYFLQEDNSIDSAFYMGLTVSTALQQLDLSHCMIPAGAWENMFAQGHHLPQLQDVRLWGTCWQREVVLADNNAAAAAPQDGAESLADELQGVDMLDDAEGEGADGAGEREDVDMLDDAEGEGADGADAQMSDSQLRWATVQAEHISSLSQCCPQLRTLQIYTHKAYAGRLNYPFDALAQVPHLQQLVLNCVNELDVHQLAQLPGLKQLHIRGPGKSKLQALMQLTVLTGLEQCVLGNINNEQVYTQAYEKSWNDQPEPDCGALDACEDLQAYCASRQATDAKKKARKEAKKAAKKAAKKRKNWKRRQRARSVEAMQP